MESTLVSSEFYQVAEIDLVYKSKVKASLRPKIKDSKDAYNIFLQVWNPLKLDLVEQFEVFILKHGKCSLSMFSGVIGRYNWYCR